MSEWDWWAALPYYQRVNRFQDPGVRNRFARVATQQDGIGGGVNAAGVQLTCCDTDCARLLLQCVGLMFKRMRQGTALRADQKHHQQQIWR